VSSDHRHVDPVDGSEGPRGWNPLAVAFIATLVLLLGLGGAVFGINAAGNPRSPNPTPLPQAAGTPTSGPTATATPTSTPTTGSTATSTPAPADTFPVPNLVGVDFMTARTKVRDLKLGWRLEFEGAGTDQTVRATDPTAGSPVKRGTTIKIFVQGAAPKAVVPSVKGKPCDEAAALVVDSGLYPTYPTGRSGVVLSQTPTSANLVWNDEMEIKCGVAP
jgi:PASTA domain